MKLKGTQPLAACTLSSTVKGWGEEGSECPLLCPMGGTQAEGGIGFWCLLCSRTLSAAVGGRACYQRSKQLCSVKGTNCTFKRMTPEAPRPSRHCSRSLLPLQAWALNAVCFYSGVLLLYSLRWRQEQPFKPYQLIMAFLRKGLSLGLKLMLVTLRAGDAFEVFLLRTYSASIRYASQSMPVSPASFLAWHMTCVDPQRLHHHFLCLFLTKLYTRNLCDLYVNQASF